MVEDVGEVCVVEDGVGDVDECYPRQKITSVLLLLTIEIDV